METSRGRFTQYKLLRKEKRLKKHLVETVLFSQKSLFSLLNQYNSVVIKPSYGNGNLIISFVNKKYKVKSNNKIITITNKEELYEYINQYEIKQKYYLIQPLKRAMQPSRAPYHFFVTIHRENFSDNWRIISVTNCCNYKILKKTKNQYFFREYKSLSIMTANKLGKSFPMCNTIVIEFISDDKINMLIYDTFLHFSVSKWDQYQTLRGHLIPKTNLLTASTFQSFIKKFNEVIIKPCNGQHGLGVVQIKKIQPFSYEIRLGNRKITKSNIDEAYRYVMDINLTNKDYIIQQKIQLAMIDNCPMDVRVITQKYKSEWNVTGKIVKLAGKDFIITNAAQKLLTLDDAIQDSTISTKDSEAIHKKIEKICLIATKKLVEKNAELRIIGFDVGVTDQGTIWIIEGNYVPDLTMFRDHKEQNVYANILKINNYNRKIRE